ncbi:MAG: HD domain-containing protein, partial [Thermoanaerobaculia bacterium]
MKRLKRERRPPIGERFKKALVFAHRLHRRQLRKGTRIPYMTHLMSVASLVLENGGGEDAAIAALLHDAVEDQGGRPTLERIRRKFGQGVAAIVDGCTDAYEQPKPSWRQRKEAHLAHLAKASKTVRLVSAADKLHNARTILSDYRALGERLWSRFNVGKASQLWYYHSLVRALGGSKASPLVGELARTVRELEKLG